MPIVTLLNRVSVVGPVAALWRAEPTGPAGSPARLAIRRTTLSAAPPSDPLEDLSDDSDVKNQFVRQTS